MTNKVRIIGRVDLDDKATTADVTLVKHQGNWHVFSVPFQISREKAAALQSELCYHPAGYGLYDFNATPQKTTWKCSNTSD